jgi:hypothetical protein
MDRRFEMPGDDEEDLKMMPISVNFVLPVGMIRAIEGAARAENLAPADWIVQVMSEKLGFTVFFNPPEAPPRNELN